MGMMQGQTLKVNKNKKQIQLKYHHFLLAPFVVLAVIFIVLPMISILMYSVTDQTSEFPIYSLTLNNYVHYLQDKLFMYALWKSLYYAFLSTVVCILVGYPISYYICKRKKVLQAVLLLLVTSPMWINMLLRTLAIKQIMQGPALKFFNSIGMFNDGILGTQTAIITGMVYVYIPFMILPIYTVLSKLDYRLVEASTDLGASKLDTFKRVILPLSIPGIMSGFTMVFLSSATTIVITKYLGEGRYNLIGNIIETEFISNGRWSYGSTIGIILLVVILVLLLITSKIDKSIAKEDFE